MFDTAREAGRYPDRISFVAALHFGSPTVPPPSRELSASLAVWCRRYAWTARPEQSTGRAESALSAIGGPFLQAGPIERRASPSR